MHLLLRQKPGWATLSILLLLASAQAYATEHPGILDRQDTCATCHSDKFRGKSVHSAMTIPCTVCHVAQTQGDMTTIALLMPKEKICFACHVKNSETADHRPAVKGHCVTCHDSHTSKRRMLLREQADNRQIPPTKDRKQ